MIDDKVLASVVGCRSDFEVSSFLGNIEIDGFKGLSVLDAESLKATSPDADLKAKRFELITAVRGGQHVELSVTARTFRQRRAPNRRYLRLAADKLESRAPTWKNQPFLTDHNTYSMSASKGKILSSKAIEESAGVVAFEQVLHVVKPESVIGVLDGTVCRFSIGWFALGPVLCTAHGVDVRSADSCSCWPGDVVMLSGKPKTVEWEFSDYEGKETSNVVIPAVKDTDIESIRAALSAELGLHPTTPRPKKKETGMRFHRLAAILGLTALAADDEGAEAALLPAVTALQARLTASETTVAGLRIQVTNAETALNAATAAGRKIQIDAIIKRDGYGAGKLKYAGIDPETKARIPSPREARLRRIAATPTGLADLAAELAEMEVVVPVNKRLQSDSAADPVLPPELRAEDELTADNPYLKNVAEQLNIPIERLVDFGNKHVEMED